MGVHGLELCPNVPFGFGLNVRSSLMLLDLTGVCGLTALPCGDFEACFVVLTSPMVLVRLGACGPPLMLLLREAMVETSPLLLVRVGVGGLEALVPRGLTDSTGSSTTDSRVTGTLLFFNSCFPSSVALPFTDSETLCKLFLLAFDVGVLVAIVITVVNRIIKTLVLSVT